MSEGQVIIRTSDRMLFRRCRRQWGMSSSLGRNLETKDRPTYFWLGTGGHFALEDFHGYNIYGHPAEAFKAYVIAYGKMCQNDPDGIRLPEDYVEQTDLACAILDHYLCWLETRNTLKTFWHNGVPQVEVRGQIPLPFKDPQGRDVYYDFTLDKIVEDPDGGLWVLDYKFYKAIQNAHLDMDPQISAYVWAASTIYERPIEGFILHQFRKDVPNPPRILANGSLSTAKNQKTVHYLYRQAVLDAFGDVDKATKKHIDCMNDLAARETPDRDDFIVRNKTFRNEFHIQAEGEKIMMEVEEMCNPDLPLYPNPTKDCSWDCWMKEICLMMDDGSDWEYLLDTTSVERKPERDTWRKYLPTPEQLQQQSLPHQESKLQQVESH